MSKVAYDLQTGLYVAAQSDAATPASITGADFVSIIGEPSFSQTRGVAQNQERRGTLGKRPGKLMRYAAGECSFETYIKPSGAAGTAPAADLLYEALMGAKTVTASTDVKYNFSGFGEDLPLLTVVVQRGHFVGQLIGCMVNQGTFTVNPSDGDDGLAKVAWSLKYLKEIRTGSGSAVSLTGSDLTLTSGHGKRFNVGSVVVVGSNTTARTITAINGDVVTLDDVTGLTVSSGDAVAPFLPTPAAEVGEPQASYVGVAKEGDAEGTPGEDIKLTSSTITINNNLEVINNEKDGSEYPSRVVRANQREVTMSMDMLFTEDAAKYFSEADGQVRRSVEIPVGNVAGSILSIEAPNVGLDVPTISGSPLINQQQNRSCYETDTGNDEITLVFK